MVFNILQTYLSLFILSIRVELKLCVYILNVYWRQEKKINCLIYDAIQCVLYIYWKFFISNWVLIFYYFFFLVYCLGRYSELAINLKNQLHFFSLYF